MAGPASPGAEGPTFAPPQLPAGWIAQWDGTSRQYYYVELATGRSQWDTPTTPGQISGGTPQPTGDHPYGVPGDGSRGDQRIITHEDGSQTIQHADGKMEPIMPGDGTRGVGGPTGERGFGSFAQTAMSSLGGGKHGGGGGSNPLGSLASSILGGGGGHGSGGGHGGGGGGASKLAAQLASGLFSSGNKPSHSQQGPAQNYHGGQAQTGSPQHSGGPLGGVFGGVASMLGGSHGKPQQNQNFGYSNTGQSGGYSGTAPPAAYAPPSTTGSTPSFQSPNPGSQTPSQPQQSQGAYTPYSGAPTTQQQHQYNAPAPQQQQYNALPPPGQSPYGGPTQPYGSSHGQQSTYGSPSQQPYGGQQQQYFPPPPPQQQPGHQPYGQQQQQPHYGAPPSQYGALPSQYGAPPNQYSAPPPNTYGGNPQY